MRGFSEKHNPWLAGACLALLLPAGRVLAQDVPEALSAKVDKTMRRSTVRSRVGPVETPLPLDISEFLLERPDIAAYLLRAHHIAPYRITMIGPRQSEADDGDGIKGIVTLVQKKEDAWLYYGEGTYKSRAFPTIQAAAVVRMEIFPVEKPGCQQHVRSVFDVYVRLRSPVLATTVKILRPFLKNMIIRKFSRAFLAAHEVGRLTARDPAKISVEIQVYPRLSEQEHALVTRLFAGLKPESAECIGVQASGAHP